jgi:hypothetical protein
MKNRLLRMTRMIKTMSCTIHTPKTRRRRMSEMKEYYPTVQLAYLSRPQSRLVELKGLFTHSTTAEFTITLLHLYRRHQMPHPRE